MRTLLITVLVISSLSGLAFANTCLYVGSQYVCLPGSIDITGTMGISGTLDISGIVQIDGSLGVTGTVGVTGTDDVDCYLEFKDGIYVADTCA